MSSDENEQNEIDCDTCTTAELSQLFDESLRITSEEAVSLQKDYILYLDNSRFAILDAFYIYIYFHMFELKHKTHPILNVSLQRFW